MRLLFITLLGLLSCFSFGQKSHTVRGSLVDTTDKAVPEAIVVLMTRADSTQMALVYSPDGVFEMTWSNKQEEEVMLFISAIGYNSKYINVDKSRSDLGNITMKPLSVFMEEVNVSVRKPIGHKFERGRDEYTVPEWLAEQSYDLNSLLAMIPGLVRTGDGIQIAGSGASGFLINGLSPRMGELESLNPKDVEKVVIRRMSGAAYGMGMLGMIDIIKKQTWRDYLCVRLKNNFSYTNTAKETPSVEINFQKNKFSQYLNYGYALTRTKYDMDYRYETVIPDEQIDNRMISDVDMYEKSNEHTFVYSPKFQIDKNSFIDAQYVFSDKRVWADNLVQTDFPDNSAPNLTSRSLKDVDDNTHYAALRYDNKFDGDNKRRLTFNTVYTRAGQHWEDGVAEESGVADTSTTRSRQKYTNEVLTSMLDYKFTLWKQVEISSGVSYGNVWGESLMNYITGGHTVTDRTRNEQAALYLEAEHAIGNFYYQVGLRGQYEYRHGEVGEYESKKRFYWLPSFGLSQRFSDDLNFMLYYSRQLKYPTVKELNPITSYVHKYLYFSGNPSLKPVVRHDIMGRMAFPLGLALICNYSYSKNDILQTVVEDQDDPKLIATTYVNIPQTHSLKVGLTWNRTFGFYTFNVNGAYKQMFTKSQFIDREIRFSKPSFSMNMTHSFAVNKYMQANIYMNYLTDQQLYTSEVEDSYSLTAQLQFSLLKNRLNIQISGDNLLYCDYRANNKYGHVLFTQENRSYPRGVSVGITYTFNNFKDWFQKNDAGEELIKRAL